MTDSPTSSKSNGPTTPVVGIGASAGGLKSIEGFFDSLPADTGMAFVVVQHLSPDFKSLMSEILARRTKIPIVEAQDGMLISADHIYLIPPGKELRCGGHVFALSEFPAGIHRPIDTFFQSLAMLDGTPVAGIILSGTGTDGSEGIRAIHRVGGLTISESIESAEFDGMPRSAKATDCVDFVLQPEEMPTALMNHLRRIDAETADIPKPELVGVQLIFSLLSTRFGINFSEYKPNTIARRIERRQQITQCPDIFAYAERLGRDESELDELYHDLLIGVTKFFRDTPAYDSLEVELERVIAELPEGEMFRVWSAGCASGEEPYSIAMIVLDLMEKLGRQPQLKVFATDVHQRVLNQAAVGVYSADSMEFVKLDRQKKYFEQLESGEFRVSSALRKHLVFARHNLIEDPPFLNINLAVCRNVLIYLNSRAQQSSLTALGFSLTNRGLLFLGSSESLGDLESSYGAVDRSSRIFRRTDISRSAFVPALVAKRSPPATLQRLNHLNPDQPESITVQMLLDVYDSALREKIPLGVLLDPKQRLLHVLGNASAFLKPVEGRFSGAIKAYLDEPARTTVASALLQSKSTPGTTFVIDRVQPDVSVDRWFDVRIMAIGGNAASAVGWIVEFVSSEIQEPPVVQVREVDTDNLHVLESELNSTKESLSATIEELEASNEELQATNEEMVASNEELQSTNEELHSVNEELHSVNAEYQRKIGELHETTTDLENLLNTSEIGTIFLGEDLCIRKYTTAAKRHFELMPHDIGRPLRNFTNKLGFPDLHDHIQSVFDSGNLISRLVRDDFGDAIGRVWIESFPGEGTTVFVSLPAGS